MPSSMHSGSQADLAALVREIGDDEAEAILSSRCAARRRHLAAPAFALIAGGEVANRAWSAALALQSHRTMGPAILISAARASDLRDLRDRVLRHSGR